MVKVKVECDTSDNKLEQSGKFAAGVVVTGENEEGIATNNFICGAISQKKLVLVLVNLLISVIGKSVEDPIDVLDCLITAHSKLEDYIKQYVKNNAGSIVDTFDSCLKEIIGEE
jgi:hypothetical protein